MTQSAMQADLSVTRGRVEYLETRLDRLKADNRELRNQVDLLTRKLEGGPSAEHGREESL